MGELGDGGSQIRPKIELPSPGLFYYPVANIMVLAGHVKL